MSSSLEDSFSNLHIHDDSPTKPSTKKQLHNGSPIDAQDELKAWNAVIAHHLLRSGVTFLDQKPVKTLEFWKKLFNSDLSIWHKTEWHENQVYQAACTEWKSKVPDVTLHAVIPGHWEASGPILGVAHFRWSRDIRFGIGDALNQPDKVAWEEMRNVSKMLGEAKYEWEFTEFPHMDDIVSGNYPPCTRRFRWQRTVDPADGVDTRLSLKTYKLMDGRTGAVVAIFLTSTLGSVRKCGELKLFENLRPKLEMAVILTSASISEKLRRD